jgi:5-formyltetrahydrofolate cyclo-ligase
MQEKIALRKKALLQRRKKYFEISSDFFNPILSMLKKIKKNNYLNVSLFYPSNFEVNTLKFFDCNKNKKIKTFLPVIRSKNKMEFIEWNYPDPLKVNQFGLLEPALIKKPLVPNVILVPLLAFDQKKNRLGYGKGFYDRFLNKFLKKKKILTIGVAFSFQKYNKVPALNSDMKLDYILTEKGLVK